MVAGFCTVGFILLVVLSALAGLVLDTDVAALFREISRPVTLSIIRFTLWQAALSTVLSLALAVPLAISLARRQHFFGRRLIILLSSISFIIPVMVAVLGIVAVHGRNGWINQLMEVVGFDRKTYLYGLGGILIAHVFFNLPLVTRILLNGLSSISRQNWDLATLYGMKPVHIFRHIEWPLIRTLLPGAAGLVFILCFTSFAIVLTLGGGPRSTTLEVAVYQAIRLDFDLTRAAALSLIQIVLCLGIVLVFFSSKITFPLQAGDFPGVDRPDRSAPGPLAIDIAVILLASLFLVSPLIAVVVKTLGGDGWSIVADARLWSSLRMSLLISVSAGLLSTSLAYFAASAVALLRLKSSSGFLAGTLETAGIMTLVVPPITLGAGLFLLIRNFTDVISLGAILVIVLNAILTLAFGMRIMLPSLQMQYRRFHQLGESLGISGWNRFKLLTWPMNRKSITYSLAITTTLSAGDMGVIALFGTEDLSTLPLLMYRLVGSYRLEQAAVVAVILCVMCFILFWFFDQLGGGETSKDVSHA